ncbi:MAG: hypothetical protein QM770_24325 [Tepidisphaeraceae bacterium]
MAEATTPAQKALRAYLQAAATCDPTKSKVFLASDCKVDFVTECKGNASSGWKYSEEYSEIHRETSNATSDRITFEVQITFGGGGTFMASTRKFTLVQVDKAWKISEIDPAPTQGAPGVSPL